MWVILKVDKKKIDILKKEFSKKLDKEIIFYQPKIKIEKYRKNKLENKVVNILGDYIFCYHKILEDQKIIDGLQYCIGVKYFLRGCKQFQKDIEKFINKFKSFENEEGYVSKSFFEINKNTYYRFSSGPFTQQVFKIIEIQKDKINILLGKVKTTINRKDFLLSPA
jgi:hypothetical protein